MRDIRGRKIIIRWEGMVSLNNERLSVARKSLQVNAKFPYEEAFPDGNGYYNIPNNAICFSMTDETIIIGEITERLFQRETRDIGKEYGPHEIKRYNVTDLIDLYPENIDRSYPIIMIDRNVPSSIVLSFVGKFIGEGLHNPPMISCLLVTKNRLELVRGAIDLFMSQTYPNKELVIVEDGSDGTDQYVRSLSCPYITILHREPSPEATLGSLRNSSIALAKGKYIAQWDDDDIYSPCRLEVMYRELIKNKAEAVLLSQWLMIWKEKNQYVMSKPRSDGWEGSMLVLKSKAPRYPSLRRGEDTIFINELRRRCKVVILTEQNIGIIYRYIVHGSNTWDNVHFDKLFIDGERISNEYQQPESSDNSSLATAILIGLAMAATVQLCR